MANHRRRRPRNKTLHKPRWGKNATWWKRMVNRIQKHRMKAAEDPESVSHKKHGFGWYW